jgi:uncharacterized protein YndB with AHSA1/START domain
MRSPDGRKEVWSTGQYLEIVTNKRIVYADHPSNPNGEITSPETFGNQSPFADSGEAFLTVEFEHYGDNETKLTLSHEGLPARMHDQCVEGWSSSLEKFGKLVEGH